MGWAKYYDLYENGKRIGEHMNSRQIAEIAGITIDRVSDGARLGTTIKGKYRIKLVEKVETVKVEDGFTKSIVEEWEMMQQLFRNVKWIKHGGEN